MGNRVNEAKFRRMQRLAREMRGGKGRAKAGIGASIDRISQ